jgi:hypothetical protein
MTDGEKRIAELLENLTTHVTMLRTDVSWFRQREQQKIDYMNKAAAQLDGLQAAVRKIPKPGE